MNTTLTEFYRVGLARPQAKIGAVCHIQRFGDAVSPHVHLHVVATDGATDEEGFHHLPLGPEDLAALAALFARRLLAALVQHGRISRLLMEKMLSWKHSGFSVDGSVRVEAQDAEGLARLLRYVARPPIANDRVQYDAATGVVTVSSAKQRGGVRPLVARYDALEFLALHCS